VGILAIRVILAYQVNLVGQVTRVFPVNQAGLGKAGNPEHLV
jgi:hypothetical protein